MPGLIAPTVLEQIRSASDIVDVVGGYLPLKRAGANFVALCPFHREKTPSFSVNPHRQIFHCFGCHKGGDVFRFVQEYENLSFVEAVRRLAERARIPLEQDHQPGQAQSRYLKETLLQIHEQMTLRWQSALRNDAAGQGAREYLAHRAVPPEALGLFRLGYAPEAWDDTVNWAKSKGYELALVEQAGLIIRKEEGDRYYDRFRGRLMFPISDEQGRVIGFSGRALNPDEKTAKYVNSPETPIFTKGKVFYGLDKTKRAILDAEFAIICEGQLDLIACYMAGVRNIVAPQGTAFTPDHARILRRYVDEVVLCFDSDTAGQAAAVRVLDSLLASGLAVRVASIPAPHDPDSFVKAFGGSGFQELIRAAQGFFDYYLNRLCQTHELGSDKGRLAVLGAMSEAVRKTDNQVIIDTYAQKTAQRLGVSAEAVRAEFRKSSRRGERTMERGQTEPAPEARVQVSPQEFTLLKLLLASDDHVEWLASRLQPEWIQDPTARRVVSERLGLHATSSWQGIPAFLSRFPESSEQDLITEALTRPLVRPEDGTRHLRKETLPHPARQLEDIALSLRNVALDRQLAELIAQFGQPGLSESDLTALLSRKEQLQRLKRLPLQPVNQVVPEV